MGARRDAFPQRPDFTFKYFIRHTPGFQQRKMDRIFEDGPQALKMGPIYRDQFVALHYFSVSLCSLPRASPVSEASERGVGGGSLLPWR